MNIERIKSILLVILVSLSIVLTVGLWSYQPIYDELEETPVILHDTFINGTEQEIRDVVKPSHIVMNYMGQHFLLMDNHDRDQLLNHLQEWPIHEFDHFSQRGQHSSEHTTIELLFPEPIPYSMIGSLLLVDNESFANREFDKMIIELADGTLGINISFVSSVNHDTITAQVRNEESYEYISGLFQRIGNEKYIEVNKYEINPNTEIYLPRQEVRLPRRTFTTNNISVSPLVNALFTEPSIVRRNEANLGKEYYTDGSRSIRIFEGIQNQRFMEFVNPVTDERNSLDHDELIYNTVQFINDHHGWTGDYYLFQISTDNTVTYRMHFNNFPIFGHDELSAINIKWINQEVNRYDRPLFRLTTSFESYDQVINLVSGERVLNFIETYYNPNLISDIKIGYTIKEESEGFSRDIISLEPEWYIEYNGTWIPLYNSDSIEKQGGSKDAMGAD
ncbi:YycH family regulatory protein [Salirhabdus salicampi]|uniref:YycH family regulatory protein n=1 Tax=Salirhabdus salicampi TaxID=476102 RepID=UPI0020C21208|nr:two-component system activity regulator YycH [Salirhabdus salicampi]MCP8617233.1 two-component system activity regulator YycH [Salirhabdus salicampi]